MRKVAVQPKSIDGIKRLPESATSRYTKTVQRAYNRTWKRVVILLVVISIGTGIFLLLMQRPTMPTGLTGQAELIIVKRQVSQHYVLPKDEEPAVLTVTDKKKLTTPFFKHVENGDRILIYQKNKIAIIYRPSIDRIVSVGPVEIGAPFGH